MEDDANMEYMLIVENDMGETPYKIRLSMNEAPAGKLDALTSHCNYFKFIIAILDTRCYIMNLRNSFVPLQWDF